MTIYIKTKSKEAFQAALKAAYAITVEDRFDSTSGNLNIPEDQVDKFTDYCDDQGIEYEIL